MATGKNDDDIKALLGVDPESSDPEKRVSKAMRRARASVGQRDTLIFALVSVWTTLAKLLAPLFARAATMQAQSGHGRPRTQKPKIRLSDGDRNGNS